MTMRNAELIAKSCTLPSIPVVGSFPQTTVLELNVDARHARVVHLTLCDSRWPDEEY